MTTEPIRDTAAARKARGAFFTPPEVTEFLCRWAIRQPTDRVLEPSCGDGAILEAAVHRLQTLGGATPVVAHELHPESAGDARELLKARGHPGEVNVGDFLATTATPGFDAVVGNPPYVRYQGFTGQARATGLAAALAQGVRLSKLASSWAPFVVHTAGYLAHGGRLALVLPAELLSANYGQEVRDFLLERFGRVSVALIDRQVFPGVQTEALLLLAEGSGGTNHVSFAIVDEAEDLHSVIFDTILDVLPGQRWTTALVSDEATRALHRLTTAGTFAPLAAWGRLSLGAVTGNNKYFLLSPSTARELGLTAEDTIRVSPPGSSHLRSLAFGLSEHGDLGERGAKTLMFRPDVPSSAGRAYIAAGEAAGVDQAYKCRVRSPWWRTPLPAPPDLFFTYMNQGTPQLAANPGQLRYVNSVHGLYLGQELKGLSDVAAVAALNSVTALSAETAGRAYGGGVLKMEPREAAALLVPAPALVRQHSDQLRDALPTLRGILSQGRLTEAQQIVDHILLGVARGERAALPAIREARDILSRRRHTRATSRSTKGNL